MLFFFSCWWKNGGFPPFKHVWIVFRTTTLAVVDRLNASLSLFYPLFCRCFVFPRSVVSLHVVWFWLVKIVIHAANKTTKRQKVVEKQIAFFFFLRDTSDDDGEVKRTRRLKQNPCVTRNLEKKPIWELRVSSSVKLGSTPCACAFFSFPSYSFRFCFPFFSSTSFLLSVPSLFSFFFFLSTIHRLERQREREREREMREHTK